nr:LysR substrate-binding domain-containing protein [Mangrovicoccus algicola]
MALSAEGAAYHAEIVRAFDILRRATGEVAGRAGVVTISVTPTFAARLLIPALPSLAAALPGIDLRTLATVAVSDLDRDQVDIAIRETRPPFPAALEARFLFRQDLVLVASPHLLGDRVAPLDPADIAALPLLHDAYDHWTRWFGRPGKRPGAVFNQVSLALDAALAGQGVAIASRAFVRADIAAGRLIDLGPAGYDTGADYYLLRRRGAPPRPAAQAVWDWCHSAFAAPPE